MVFNEKIFSNAIMSTTMQVRLCSWNILCDVSLKGWLYRCTSMWKGMGPCLCIAHVYLDRIILRFCFLCTWIWMHEYVMNVNFMLWCQVCDMMEHEYSWYLNVFIWKDCSYVCRIFKNLSSVRVFLGTPFNFPLLTRSSFLCVCMYLYVRKPFT